MKKLRVVVIDPQKQKFNGEVFYRCGFYFQRKGKRLHRAVWEYYNGPIPKGFHIHHIDGDRSNNNIENLSCESAHEHLSNHGHSPEREAYGKMHIDRIRPKAAEWHKSKAGIAWHSQHGKRSYETRKINTYCCTQCGTAFQTRHIYTEGSNHYCCGACRAKYNRERKKK